jgi:hypothetical protein
MSADISDRIIEVVEQTASETWQRLVQGHMQMYDRDKLAGLGITMAPVAVHDYSIDGTRIIVERIKLKLETELRREASWAGTGGIGGALWLAPYHAALRVEEAHLAAFDKPIIGFPEEEAEKSTTQQAIELGLIQMGAE